ncbi:nitroreductase [Thermodesulfobacteriota bacterium]
MDVAKAVAERRSIRCFKPDEVPEDLVREILDQARWSPSWGNTQPWEFYVLTGKVLAEFRDANRKNLQDRVLESPDVPMPLHWPESLKKRRSDLAERFLSSLSIGREEKEARMQFYTDLYGLFEAPCLILTCIDRSLSIEYAMLDAGLINQTICLLAHEKGLGTCIMAASVSYAGLIREAASIPEEKIIVIGVTLGYPDRDSPINQFQREREDIDKVVTWVR